MLLTLLGAEVLSLSFLTVLCHVSQSVSENLFFQSSDIFDLFSQLKLSTKTIKEPHRGELAVKLRHQMCSAVHFSMLWKTTQLFPHLSGKQLSQKLFSCDLMDIQVVEADFRTFC